MLERVKDLLFFGIVGIFSIFLLLVALAGPGGALSVLEWPFGSGPMSVHGRYCTSLHAFAAEVRIATDSPSQANFENLKKSLDNVITRAPGPSIRTSLQNWSYDQAYGDSGAIRTDGHAINSWIISNCSSATYRWPFDLNEIYNGLFGGPMF